MVTYLTNMETDWAESPKVSANGQIQHFKQTFGAIQGENNNTNYYIILYALNFNFKMTKYFYCLPTFF